MDARLTCSNCGNSRYTIEILRHEIDEIRSDRWLDFLLTNVIASHNWPSNFKKCVHTQPGVIKATGTCNWWSIRGLKSATICNRLASSNGLRRKGIRRSVVDVMDPVPGTARVDMPKGSISRAQGNPEFRDDSEVSDEPLPLYTDDPLPLYMGHGLAHGDNELRLRSRR